MFHRFNPFSDQLAAKCLRQTDYAMNQGKVVEDGARLPILALTASAFEEDRAAILALGCSDIEYKPIQEERLLAAIGRLLGANYEYQTACACP